MSLKRNAVEPHTECFPLKTLDISRNKDDATQPKQANTNNITTEGVIVCLDHVHDGAQDEISDDNSSVIEEEISVVGERETNRVRFLDNSNSDSMRSRAVLYKSFGKKGDGYGQLQDAVDIKCLPDGNIVVTDMVNNKLQIFTKSGRAGAMYIADEMVEPWGVALTTQRNFAVVSTKTRLVSVIDQNGKVLSSFGNECFQYPCGIVTTDAGHFIITDSVADTVSLHSADGDVIHYYEHDSLPFKQPRYVAVSPNGDVVVSDSGNHCVKVFDQSGSFVRQMGGYGTADGCLKFPRGVCVDSAGDIYVADHYNNRISVFSNTGEFLRHLITSSNGLHHPQGVAMSTNQSLFVTHGDLKASQIMMFKLPPNVRTQDRWRRYTFV